MNIRHLLTIICLVLFSAHAASAQTGPTTHPEATFEEQTIANVKFSDIPLDAVLDYFRDQNPAFQPNVLRDPRLPKDYPRITFAAKNVSVPQFLKFLDEAYQIKSSRIDGAGGPLVVITVKQDNRFPLELPSREVQAYRLRDILSQLRRPDSLVGLDGDKQILNDVLTLVQVSLKEANGGKGISLQVHEPTQTLIVSGTVADHFLISNVLQALRPSPELVKDREYAELQNRISRLEQINRGLRQQNDQYTAQLQQLTLERANLPTTSTTTRPKE